MRVAVIGSGIFGCTAATHLARAGYDTHLFDRAPELMTGASAVNQFRLHRGFHYPRSSETVWELQEALPLFRAEYGGCLIPQTTVYGIAAEGSKLTAADYLRFCETAGLPFRATNSKFFNADELLVAVAVKEERIDPAKLRFWGPLAASGVNVNLNTPAHRDMRKDFDAVIVAAYAGTNSVLVELGCEAQPLQYEVIEKPVLSFPANVPHAFIDFSVVVMDGEFCSLDPYGSTKLHLMGHVKHAIHHSNTGIHPETPEHLREYIGAGPILCPEYTNFRQLIGAGKRYIPALEWARHIGSMFTVRAVLPNRDADDARPTLVERVGDNVVRIFSGKIGTCVSAAKQVVDMVGGARRKAA